MKKCPYCAEAVQDEAIKCPHCAEQIKATTRSTLSLIVWGLFGVWFVYSFLWPRIFPPHSDCITICLELRGYSGDHISRRVCAKACGED